MHLGQKFREIRKQKGLTQSQLAKQIGVPNIYISKWEAGKGHPSVVAFGKLVKALGITADYFLFENIAKAPIGSGGDLQLYEYFRKAESLPAEKRQTVIDVIDSLVFREKIKEMPEADLPKPDNPTRMETRRKVAGRR